MPMMLANPEKWARLSASLERPKVYSQDGEEHVIAALFDRPDPDEHLRRFVDIGAWDGVYLSNVHALALAGWRGALIESDGAKFDLALRNYADRPDILVRLYKLTLADGIDPALAGPSPCDFLNLDIDGEEYELLCRMKSRPLVLCVEHQATDGPDCLPGMGAYGQAGMNVMARMLASRGYELVAYNACNGIYVHESSGITP